jgi:hypothetical protein
MLLNGGYQMKLREFDFNSINHYIGLSVKGPDGKWYESCDGIGATLRLLPIEFADKEIKDTRTYFGSYVIELEEEIAEAN